MKTRKRRVSRTLHEVEIQGKWFELGIICELLEGLEDTDGYVYVIVINESAYAEILEAEKVAIRTVRGSYYKGPAFKAFREKINEAIG